MKFVYALLVVAFFLHCAQAHKRLPLPLPTSGTWEAYTDDSSSLTTVHVGSDDPGWGTFITFLVLAIVFSALAIVVSILLGLAVVTRWEAVREREILQDRERLAPL